MKEPSIYIVMGVSGSGKTSIGKLLAQKLEVPFFDGDDYHSPENIQKMTEGIPLNDADRKVWLATLNLLARKNLESGAVIACSALKQAYRSQLMQNLENRMRFVYLEGSFNLIWERLQKRKNHFMPANLLKSQFDALEPPEKAIGVSITKSPETILLDILTEIGQNKGG